MATDLAFAPIGGDPISVSLYIFKILIFILATNILLPTSILLPTIGTNDALWLVTLSPHSFKCMGHMCG